MRDRANIFIETLKNTPKGLFSKQSFKNIIYWQYGIETVDGTQTLACSLSISERTETSTEDNN